MRVVVHDVHGIETKSWSVDDPATVLIHLAVATRTSNAFVVSVWNDDMEECALSASRNDDWRVRLNGPLDPLTLAGEPGSTYGAEYL